ncbi:MAG: phosphonate ABC transporter ATP-binding protein [Bdellovibrionales bacterium]|nr:phosphonate ABC transporter ATP-binding protein [Bdellovibrionales bacterium]
MSVIHFEGADLVYPNGFHGLKTIDLDIKAGEFIAIIGRSGAGKSTLLRAINRTIDLTGGKAQVLDHNLRNMPRAELKKLRGDIGFIFQQFNLVKNLTALDNVLHGRLAHVGLVRSMLGLYPESERRLAQEALNSVGLNEKHNARIDELSGGQQQRVAIARAIVQDPKIILADEPMASLDPKLSEVVLELLQKFNRERKMTVLVNMHVLDHARRYATRVIGMRQGHVVFDGPIAKLDAAALNEVYEGAVS